VSLLQGKTVGEAHDDQLKKYEEEITYWVEGEGKNNADASEIARILNINKSINTFAGLAGTKPSPAGGAATGGKLELAALIPVGLLVLGLLWFATGE
jgi:hypothetical protein